MTENSTLFQVKNLVIGSGLAGLMVALKLAEHEEVVILTKESLEDSNSIYAQGGIASVLGSDDTFESHVEDTLKAGAGICHESIVKMVVEAGPNAIQELCRFGVAFTKKHFNSQEFHLTREGGHSKRRVLHADDATGAEIIRALVATVQAHPNIKILESHHAIDLLTTDRYQPNFSYNACLGVYAYHCVTQKVVTLLSQRTFLCTGGHGRIYLFTTNPKGATGDGLAMGWRAGCRVANLEFMQFHPTCLFHSHSKPFLITEAIRGEGGVLRNLKGEEFVKRAHPLGSLAPRDIVARAIDRELKSSGQSHVFLDITHKSKDFIINHFPNIYKKCLSIGIDISQEWIPVVPAAHYSCGGLVVDEFGRTNVRQLYAIGEVACTGLHGANRLASNSLLEAVVFAQRAAHHALNHSVQGEQIKISEWDTVRSLPPDQQVILSHTWDEIRRLMWHYVGIERSDERLLMAKSRIEAIIQEINRYYWTYQVNENLLEVRNIADVSYLTIQCAIRRKESRGIHFNINYPENSEKVGIDTIL